MKAILNRFKLVWKNEINDRNRSSAINEGYYDELVLTNYLKNTTQLCNYKRLSSFTRSSG